MLTKAGWASGAAGASTPINSLAPPQTDGLVASITHGCKQRDPGNGTENFDCTQNKIGSHTEQKEIWNDFDKRLPLTKGNITIGIFVDVYPDERVEWIPTLFGVKINDWAIWIEALNDELLLYYNFTSETESLRGGSYDLIDGSGTAEIIANGSSFPLEDGSSGYFPVDNGDTYMQLQPDHVNR